MSKTTTPKNNNNSIKFHPYDFNPHGKKSNMHLSFNEELFPENEDNNNIPENEENKNIVYLVALCHGDFDFYFDDDDDDDGKEDDDDDNLNNYSYDFIEIPEQLEYFNKITFAPLGFNNIVTSRHLTSVKTSIAKLIEKHVAESGKPLVHTELRESLPRVDNMLTLHEEIFCDYLKKKELDERKTKIKCDLISLKKMSEYLYKSVVYEKDKNNINFINKTFETDKIDPEMNIYIVYAKGGNGKLVKGDKILGSKAYLDYLRNKKIDLRNKKIEERISWLDDFKSKYSTEEYEERIETIKKKVYEETDEETENTNKITTEDLLGLAVSLGFRRVIALDYSCNGCSTQSGKIVSRKLVIKLREEIEKGMIGQGIHKKLKKTKKRISRKLQKSKKNQKRIKKYKKN